MVFLVSIFMISDFWHSPFNVLFVKIWVVLSNELFYLVSRLRCVFVSLYTIINYEDLFISLYSSILTWYKEVKEE